MLSYANFIFCLCLASLPYLTGTRLIIANTAIYVCKYNSNLAEAELTGTKVNHRIKEWSLI